MKSCSLALSHLLVEFGIFSSQLEPADFSLQQTHVLHAVSNAVGLVPCPALSGRVQACAWHVHRAGSATGLQSKFCFVKELPSFLDELGAAIPLCQFLILHAIHATLLELNRQGHFSMAVQSRPGLTTLSLVL